MDKLVIQGGHALSGSVVISGAKNAALPILAATILATEPVKLNNVPKLRDIKTMIDLLARMGMSIRQQDETLFIMPTELTSQEAPYELVRTMRASILVLGPLLARYGRAEVALPGGCAIGSRPVDFHIQALRQLGAKITVDNGVIRATAPHGLKGADITFPKVTVTGTENLLMAAALADGITVLHNVAQEPEVTDLAHFLTRLGANISGIGSKQLVIQGRPNLLGGEHQIIFDRIEAGTFLVAGAMTKGDVKITSVQPRLLTSVLDALKRAGAEIKSGEDWVSIHCAQRPRAVNINTEPYPGFPTDMQAQFMALNTIAEGSGVIVENIFENRFMHVQELRRMGAEILLNGRTATCIGKLHLSGAPVMATDLRASAGLILAALVAEGETTIDRVYHLDRGYSRIEEKLGRLGAKIARIGSQGVKVTEAG